MDNIEKGILSDGMNLKTNDNSWSIGGEGQPTVEGFQDFAIGFAEMIHKEVSGYYLSNPQTPDVVSTIYMGRHRHKQHRNRISKRQTLGAFAGYAI